MTQRRGDVAPQDDVDTDVLIVGTGPCGGAAALALATYGVRVRVATKRRWLADSPRAHITNQRTMEVLRDLGVEEQATAVATPWNLMGDMVFATSLTGREIARLRTWGTGDDRRSNYLRGSPCPMLDIPQPLLEPVLIENAAARGADVCFNTEYLSHEQDASGVTTLLRDRLTAREYTVRSRYLYGADGAHSRVMANLGLELHGTMGRAGTMYTRFTADLTRFVAHRPSILHRIVSTSATFGEIGLATLRAIRPWDEWIAGWGYDLAGPPPNQRPEAVLPRLREMIGDADVEVDVNDVSLWQVNQAWATQYSLGRVFCGGDAVHRHPPSSGLGSNTSVQDAFNIAWKLAYVIQGWASPSLLDSYTQERAPVGKQVVARANQSRLDYGPLKKLLRGAGAADSMVGIAALSDRGPTGVAAREALVEAISVKNDEFNAQGVEMNQRYTSCAIVPDQVGDEEDEAWPHDRTLHLQATSRPGAKIPHVWLVNGASRRTSTLDATGKGRFCLVTGLSGGAWSAAAARLNLPFLTVVTVGEPGLADAYHDWHRVREMHEAGALLVRPDGYIAWRHPAAVCDEESAASLLRKALFTALSLKEVQLSLPSRGERQPRER